MINVEETMLEQIDNFSLGAVITENSNCETEMSKQEYVLGRIFELTTIWSSRALTNATKQGLLRALVRLLATYGAESWTMI